MEKGESYQIAIQRYMGRYKSRELVHFWVDYVKAHVEIQWEKIHQKLRLSANSNISYYDEYTFIELIPDMMSAEYGRYYQIKDKATGISIAFLWLNGHKIGNITRSDFFEVTGQGLIIRSGYKYFVKMAEDLNLKIIKYNRVDICMDININTQYFLETIVKDFWEKKTRTPWYTKGILHAMYYGEKMLSKNTYQFLRVYNKKMDSHNKGKEWLYDNYQWLQDVTRLEVEIRRDKAVFLTTEKILNTEYLFGVCVRTFYPMNNQFFSFLHLEDFKKVIEKDGIWKKRLRNQAERKLLQDMYGCSFKNPKEKKQWQATFLAYAKKLYVNWCSVLELKTLLQENLTEEIPEIAILNV